MTRPDPSATDPLDPGEQSLARIMRALPASEPSPALDRLILKSAQNALASQPRRHRWHWLWAGSSLGGAGTAAAAVLAIGITWQVLQGPTPPYPASPTAPVMQSSDAGPARLQVELLERAAPAASAPPPAEQDTAKERTALTAAPAAKAIAPRTADRREAAPMPEPLPAPMSPPAAFTDEHVDRSAPLADHRDVSEPAAQKAAAPAAALAAPTAITFDADALARAKADLRLAPRLWLRRIEQRLDDGDTAGARASAALFRERYPEQHLPERLQILLQTRLQEPPDE